MFCPNCGYDCQSAKFCPECGRDLRNLASVADPAQDKEGIQGHEPPVGRYANHDHDYIELGASSLILYRKPTLQKSTVRTVPYDQIKGVSYASGAKLGAGGFLSLQESSSGSKPKASFRDAMDDETSIIFSWKQNDAFLQVYEFLKTYADTAIKNHQTEKWPVTVQADTVAVARSADRVPDDDFVVTWEDVKRSFNPKKAAFEEKKAELEKTGQVYCPKCLSTSVSANKKGFSFVKGAIGATVTLGVGIIAGSAGSNKILCTCMKCGYQWKPGKK